VCLHLAADLDIRLWGATQDHVWIRSKRDFQSDGRRSDPYRPAKINRLLTCYIIPSPPKPRSSDPSMLCTECARLAWRTRSTAASIPAVAGPRSTCA
jgi:hypothetical protein